MDFKDAKECFNKWELCFLYPEDFFEATIEGKAAPGLLPHGAFHCLLR